MVVKWLLKKKLSPPPHPKKILYDDCHPILHYQTCLPNLALTPRSYLFLHTLSGLLPMFTQAHCLCILRLTAYVFSGSLPMYSQAHCLCILRLTAYVFSGSLPIKVGRYIVMIAVCVNNRLAVSCWLAILKY